VDSRREGSDGGSQVQAAGLSRRGFLSAAGAVGSAAAVGVVAGTGTARAATETPLAQERAMILQVASAGLLFPFRYPVSGQAGSLKTTMVRRQPGQRGAPSYALAFGQNQAPTMARLIAAERRMPAGRLSLARAGARSLVQARLFGVSQATLLEGIGRRAAIRPGGGDDALVAAVALAIGTVFPHFRPAQDTPADLWVGALRIMHQRGALGPILRERGIR
jgi:hypothetical protein